MRNRPIQVGVGLALLALLTAANLALAIARPLPVESSPPTMPGRAAYTTELEFLQVSELVSSGEIIRVVEFALIWNASILAVTDLPAGAEVIAVLLDIDKFDNQQGTLKNAANARFFLSQGGMTWEVRGSHMGWSGRVKTSGSRSTGMFNGEAAGVRLWELFTYPFSQINELRGSYLVYVAIPRPNDRPQY